MQIKLITNSSGLAEWMIVELHGLLSSQEGELDSKTIGTICWKSKGQAFMVVGNQTLEGKITNLPRPMLCIQKSDELGMDGSNIAHINAIIRKRLLFKTRPRPLVISKSSVQDIPTQ